MSQLLRLFSACMVVAACGHRASAPVLVDSDVPTAAADTVHVPTMEELMLPDTCYASAAILDYRVDLFDSLPAPLRHLDDVYEQHAGVLTFRKNLLRNAAFGGTLQGEPSRIDIAWTFATDDDQTATDYGTWGGGTGWTGQPLYAEWTDDEMMQFRAASTALTSDFGRREIMFGSLCGKAYFINFDTGKASREALDLGNVVKGTMSLDPRYHNLYVGQGVPHQQPFGCQVMDLLRHECTFFFNDQQAWRRWQAFDSSPIVAGEYLFWPGENGSVYKFERRQGSLRLLQALRYRVNGVAPGIESSLCVYRNYGFFADNHGYIVCLNLNNMRPVWAYYNHDDTDGTIVCREEEGTPYVYSACEVDRQGQQGQCYVVKLRATDGQLVWQQQVPCERVQLAGKSLDGGMYATPLLGTGDCAHLLFLNLCRNGTAESRGELVALRTSDGSTAYTVPYGQFAWSSPIAFTSDAGHMYVFTAAATGRVYLVRGLTGQVVCQRYIGYNIESSPIAVGNAAVVGVRGRHIYKFTIN